MPVIILNAPPLVRMTLCSVVKRDGYALVEPPEPAMWLEDDAPAVVLVTVESLDDLEASAALVAQKPHTLLITIVPARAPHLCEESIKAGASATLPSDCDPSDIGVAIAAAEAGYALVPITSVRALASPPGRGLLRSHEIGWLRTLASGTTVADVAQTAGYSPREMFRRLQIVYRRMGATNRTEALVLAAQRGLLD